MIDLHSHILPGIDDGAKTIEDSLAMAQIAVDNGTTVIAATPHVIEGRWLPEWSTIKRLCVELSGELKKKNIVLTIVPGAEVALNMDILNLVEGPGPYCINGGRYMLVELPATHIPQYTDEFFFTLQARGISPILAHPERHPEIARNPELIVEWVNKGILMQMNGPSLVGKMGERAMKTAEVLLNSKLVHIIGSDAHSPKARTPRLTNAEEKAISLVGEELTRQIFYLNLLQILNSEEIAIPDVQKIKNIKKMGLLNRIINLMQ
ncbi:protein-tyrosine phosphatase [Anaerospora hongkongensis]|uniref:protein-tyrosine-phosphatase n=1 Tax=Anaerospora hongkongensis TaxID=244830 RepID=A0A4R1PV59_9FIRM|nr:CpsB/CapC family capsule biosynthesis tyrosine phosphatase [Anaerospora hongkongensis]TCL36059.1 protein-tyrosine phosphatase [Anaerospora hongkongensis]